MKAAKRSPLTQEEVEKLIDNRVRAAANQIGQTMGMMVTALLAIPPKPDGTSADADATLRALFAAQASVESEVGRECADGFAISVRFALGA
jgi:hypothetical protein